MSENKNSYEIDPHIAEFYDQHETQMDDVELIRRLVADRVRLRILEPFCGTGRILIPLAEDGHEMVGLDQSEQMLDRARTKIAELPPAVGKRITLIRADATAGDWPAGFDLLLLDVIMPEYDGIQLMGLVKDYLRVLKERGLYKIGIESSYYKKTLQAAGLDPDYFGPMLFKNYGKNSLNKRAQFNMQQLQKYC